MKTLILYFSYAGATRALAEKLAGEHSADLCEVRYQKRPGVMGAVLHGCPGAMGQRPARVQPFGADYAAYDKIVLMAPIWAGYPAPPFNNMLAALPGGTAVELVLVSSSGHSKRARVEAKARTLGLTVAAYRDVKAGEEAQ